MATSVLPTWSVTSFPFVQLQESIRIAVAELLHIGRGEWKAVEEGTALRVGGIGIIDRKHDAVDAKRQQRRNERRLAEHAAGREPDLFEDGAADRPLQVPGFESEHIIST